MSVAKRDGWGGVGGARDAFLSHPVMALVACVGFVFSANEASIIMK